MIYESRAASPELAIEPHVPLHSHVVHTYTCMHVCVCGRLRWRTFCCQHHCRSKRTPRLLSSLAGQLLIDNRSGSGASHTNIVQGKESNTSTPANSQTACQFPALRKFLVN